MNKELVVDLLRVAHPDTILPEGAFYRLLESEFFATAPTLLVPLASVSTLGFSVFEERGSDDEFINKYENILGNINVLDAINYRGRGIFHHSFVGRNNYSVCGETIGVDLENNPQIASSNWDVMVKIADWQLEQAIVVSGSVGGPRIGRTLGIIDVDCLNHQRVRGEAGRTTLFGYWLWNWLRTKTH